MTATARFAAIVTLVLAASGCRVHIVGDSTAWLVQGYAAQEGYVITGSPTPSCGYTTFNGLRRSPDNPPSTGYVMCTIDWVGADEPDAPDDVIFAFVSIHDAMCSTIDGCLPVDASVYADVHAHLSSLGYPVVWVEVPLCCGPLLHDRIAELNAAVATELGCTLVPGSVRVAPTWDGLHYLPDGGKLVGARLALLATNPPAC